MKKKYKFPIILLLAFTCGWKAELIAQVSPLVVQDPLLLAAKADTILRQTVALGEHVGISAGIYANGQIIWEAGAGYMDMQKGIPADAHMVHRIASISKPMTALAILQLVEQGKIDLDAPIQDYVPEFPVKAEGTITVRHLLSHTSGINGYKGFLDGFSFKEYPNLMAAMRRFQGRGLVGVPGDIYQYTTYGYVVLGAILEKASGMSYEAYMKQHVWEPAGMFHTSAEHKKETVQHKSGLYRYTRKGKLKKDLNTNISMKVPGGGLQSTAGDLLRFGQAILDHTLLKKETLALMWEDQKVRPVEAGNPYSLGWFLYKNKEERIVIGHAGSQAGTSTQFMILPEEGIVISILSNTRGQWGKVFGMAWQLIDLALSSKGTQKPLPQYLNLKTEALDQYVGKYDFGNGEVLEIKRNGNQLFSNLNQYKGLKLYPEKDHKLSYRHNNAYFSFEMGSDNTIRKTTYVQNGKVFHPEKIK